MFDVAALAFRFKYFRLLPPAAKEYYDVCTTPIERGLGHFRDCRMVVCREDI